MNKPFRVQAARRQSGVVLIVAMVMLVIIGLASVAIMRNTLSNDIIADNNRLQSQAMQAAQAGLRYCESLAGTPTQTAQAAAASPDLENWNTFANWTGNAGATLAAQAALQVPASFVNSLDSSATKRRNSRKLPQCMAQIRSLGTANVYVVTARGFSDNYIETNGRTQTGAVVWLQSIVQF